MYVPFKRQFEIERIRPGTGAWVDGVYVEPVREPGTILCNIQPVTGETENLLRDEVQGRRFDRAIRVNAEEKLNVAGDNDEGDIVIYNDRRYLLCKEQTWDNSRHFTIAHYRYIGLDCQIEGAGNDNFPDL